MSRSGAAPLHSAARAKLARNRLKGILEPLRGCTELHRGCTERRSLTGGLEPLRGCTGLRMLDLTETQLVPTDEDRVHLEKHCRIFRI